MEQYEELLIRLTTLESIADFVRYEQVESLSRKLEELLHQIQEQDERITELEDRQVQMSFEELMST